MLSSSSSSSFTLKFNPLITPSSHLSHPTRPTTIKCFRAAAATATAPPSLPKLTSTKTKSSSTLYEILRVDQRASATDIKNAYRALAKLYHPDVVRQHPEADGMEFVQIRNAYDTLSDPMARSVYDLGLERRNAVVRCRRGRGDGLRWTTRRWETDQCW